MTTTTLRWRLNDPGEDNRVRWSRVHIVREDDTALCGARVPETPYDVDRNEWIPDDAPACFHCYRINRVRNEGNR